MFTEPADQSVWWYHHFLLTWAEEGAVSSDSERYQNILRAEAATLEELIEVEGRCKVCAACRRWSCNYGRRKRWGGGRDVFVFLVSCACAF